MKVGKPESDFPIHRGVLRHASKFFNEELANSVMTVNGMIDHVVTISNEDPEIFGRFKNWLYTNSMISEAESHKELAWCTIISTYLFAERNGIPRLQNHCVDVVIRKRQEGGLFPAKEDVNTLWKAKGTVFRLRRLLLHLFATECNLQHAIEDNGSYHKDFLQDLVLILYGITRKQDTNKQVDFWVRRQIYYVDDVENPIILD